MISNEFFENYNSSKIYNSTIEMIYFGAKLKPGYEINLMTIP